MLFPSPNPNSKQLDLEKYDSGENIGKLKAATGIQPTVPHHPWLDLIPFPYMRDTLILTQDFIDEERLCRDLSGQGASGVQHSGREVGIGETGILVWKHPWDPSGWEITETFRRLWGWTVRDCWDLFRSTNTWRSRRGERPLFAMFAVPERHDRRLKSTVDIRNLRT